MKIKILTLFAAAVGCLGACSAPQTVNQNAGNATPAAAASPSAMPSIDPMAAGKKLYADNCSICHLETGKGGRMEIEGKRLNVEDLTADKIKKMPDDKLYRYVYEGVEDEGMPAFKDKLTEAEIREVVRYVRIELQGVPESQPAKTPGVN